jgi:hypothetical protein
MLRAARPCGQARVSARLQAQRDATCAGGEGGPGRCPRRALVFDLIEGPGGPATAMHDTPCYVQGARVSMPASTIASPPRSARTWAGR